ncbi:MAG TPA: NADP-dependent malic enzyme [Candidatus Nitrosotalea sp.]|nr:NADP-dependent malic enzyme [Candidatus Nitrosotalea sp.]
MAIDKNSRRAIALHKKLRGKIIVTGKMKNLRSGDIKLIYTPGVAAVCEEIYHHPEKKFDLTSKGNNVAIVTDGTRILGLGNIGPYAALPVMEGKAVLYREFGGVSAFPLCLGTTRKEEIVAAVRAVEPAFGAINLEDIESPKVLEISDELSRLLSIPVFHDDRHGTSVVVLAGLLNSMKLVKKNMKSMRVVIAGAGSAGYGICKLLVAAGCKNILVTDSGGIIYKGRRENMNKYKNEMASITNKKLLKGQIGDAMRGADVFIGVSGIRNLVSPSMIRLMSKDPVIFALTNPDPEIRPNLAKAAGARIVATGSYLYPNKVNNALVFPHLMRVILDKKITRISEGLLAATARAIANTVPEKKLHYDNILPDMYDKAIQKNIARAVLRLA